MIYINDLPDSVVSDIALYADDTKIFKDIQLDSDNIVVQNDLFRLHIGQMTGCFYSTQINV